LNSNYLTAFTHAMSSADSTLERFNASRWNGPAPHGLPVGELLGLALSWRTPSQT